MIDIRRADEHDRDSILALWEAADGPAKRALRERFWDWRWRRRPGSAGYQGVIALEGARAVGSMACAPAGLHVRGRPVAATWEFESIVHPGYRRHGVMSRLLAAAAEFGCGLAKDTSEPMLAARLKAGFRTLPASGYWERTLSHEGRLRRATGALIGGALRPLADIAVPALPQPALPVEAHDGPFDARFDALWEAVASGYDAIGRRDAACLQWRFRDRPDAAYRVLTLAGPSGGSLRGYAVCRAMERRQRRRGILSDLLTGRDDEEARRALLAAACRCLAAWGADSVRAYVADARSAQALRDLGFRPARRPSPMTVRGDLPAEIFVAIQDGDGD